MSAFHILCPCHGLADVKTAPVCGDVAGGVVGIVYCELSERLITLAEVSLYLAVGPLGFAIVLIVQQFPNLRQGLECPRCGHVAVGFSRPQSDVVERYAVCLGAAVYDSSHSAVAYHEGFFEIFGRAVVMQCETVVGLVVTGCSGHSVLCCHYGGGAGHDDRCNPPMHTVGDGRENVGFLSFHLILL